MTAWALAVAAGALAALFAALWLHARRRARDRQRELERELERIRTALDLSSGARELFFDLVTHELRSPLAAILGYQELLADGLYGDLTPAAAEPVERLGRSARHLLHLVDGIVELTQLRTGRVQLDLGSVDLGGLCAALADAFRVHGADRGVETRAEIPRALPVIRSDQDRLVRGLDLFLTSAVKHAAGPEIQLDVSAHDDGVTLHVAPTAIEARSDTDDPTVRFGIRLAVAQAIARRLGGSLDYHTDDKGAIRALSFRIRDAAGGASGPSYRGL